MSDRESDTEGASATPSQSRKLRKWAAGGIGAVVLAGAVAFASGLGNRAAESVGKSESAPISYSVEELSPACFSAVFLPEDAAQEVLGDPADPAVELMKLDPAAAAAGAGMVQVAVQGESERKVTLTGIEFDVEKAPLPDGAVFDFPCGDATVGRVIAVDLDAVPPQITASSAEVGGSLGTFEGRPLSRPIRFPWTVSLTDPLLLRVIATTDRCYCTWTAEIPWVSGSKRGVISVDDKGEGFRVINPEDVDSYGVGSGGKWVGSG
ncbi:MAG TPA: hypothetical protein VF255_09050 [Solirubrobacterales bacterium]